MSASRIFTDAFDSIQKTISFNKHWSNGTGYFDGTITDESFHLEPGEMVKSISDDGRRIIITQTRLGRVTLFDRKVDRSGFIAINYDSELSQFNLFDTSGGVGEADMQRILGGWGRLDKNLGHQLEKLVSRIESLKLT